MLLLLQLLLQQLPDILLILLYYTSETELVLITYIITIIYSPGYLLLSEARHEDSGLYLCIASNHVGKDIAKATVIVTGKQRTIIALLPVS